MLPILYVSDMLVPRCKLQKKKSNGNPQINDTDVIYKKLIG